MMNLADQKQQHKQLLGVLQRRLAKRGEQLSCEQPGETARCQPR